ncbi:hypothetical protein G5714_002041 [Onychostoma macrolepis]|uniref:Ig-like domain-containing protein n=1 Tax=Onychostoma macrolepis TaxID=369639 RepID=A0A7J6DDU6_9TELE|nr:hypothetical protein G5714_002041 [Onychostoma macrolepis]
MRNGRRLCLFSLISPVSAAVFGNVIKPNKTDIVYEEDSNVTLTCSHSPGASDTLYWYRQYGRSKPEFLVLTYGSAKEAQRSDVDPRFSVKLEKREKKHVDLEISSAAVSDSALYYCALQPTVTGNTSALYKNLLQ